MLPRIVEDFYLQLIWVKPSANVVDDRDDTGLVGRKLVLNTIVTAKILEMIELSKILGTQNVGDSTFEAGVVIGTITKGFLRIVFH